MIWRLTVSNPLHGESPLEEHAFVANPLAFTAHKDRLPNAQETCARAYALRATKESYLTAMRQLNTRELAISRKKYYNLYRGLGGLPPRNGGQNHTLGALELLL